MKLSEINFKKKDENLVKDNDDINLKSVYQIQGMVDTDRCRIMEVGRFNKLPNIEITQFATPNKLRCILVSCMFDKEKLEQNADSCCFDMIKVVINAQKGEKLHPIAYLSFNANIFTHKQDGKNILEYVLTRDSLEKQHNDDKLKTFFSTKFHCNNKTVVLDKFKKYPGENSMVEKLISYLTDENVKIVLDNTVSKLNL